MDSAGILPIFQRSVEHHNACYIEFLVDGDSKAHNLVQENVYGDVAITKLECVSHVQKRLGSLLQPLKKMVRNDCFTWCTGIGWKGKLTEKLINPFTATMTYSVRHDFCIWFACMTYWVRQENEGQYQNPGTSFAKAIGTGNTKKPFGTW